MAIACSPATPAPITKTRAGATVPAAVVSIGKSFGRRAAAIRIALYPAIVDCEDNTSMLCARAMRGTSSIAKTVQPRRASSARSSGGRERLAHADDDLPLVMAVEVVATEEGVRAERPDLQQDVGGEDLVAVGQLGAVLLIRRVGVLRCAAGPPLHDDGEPGSG